MTNTRHKVKNSVYKGANKIKSEVNGVARNAKSAISDAAEEAVETAREYAGEALDFSKDAMSSTQKRVTKWVRQNPMTALAVGVGIGLVLGRKIFRS